MNVIAAPFAFFRRRTGVKRPIRRGFLHRSPCVGWLFTGLSPNCKKIETFLKQFWRIKPSKRQEGAVDPL